MKNTATPARRVPRATVNTQPKARILFELEPALRSGLVDLAFRRGVTLSHLLRTLLAAGLAAADANGRK